MVNFTDIFNQSISSDSRWSPSTFRNLETERVIWVSVTTLFCIFGTTINFIILLMIKTNPKLRTGSGLLIGHLILTYLIQCCVSIPTRAFLTHRPGQSPLGTCHFALFLYVTCAQAGNWTDACLAINRVIAIWFPQKYKIAASRSFITGMMVATWVPALVYVVPRLSGVGGAIKFSPIGMCGFVGDGSYQALLSFLTVLFYTPYAILGIGSVAVLVRMMLIKNKKNHRVRQVGEENGIVHRRMGAAKMLLVSFFWCCLCYSPTATIVNFYPNILVKVPTVVLWLVTCVAAQCAINPLIFFAMSEDYREAFDILMSRKRNIVEPRCRTGVSTGNYETKQ